LLIPIIRSGSTSPNRAVAQIVRLFIIIFSVHFHNNIVASGLDLRIVIVLVLAIHVDALRVIIIVVRLGPGSVRRRYLPSVVHRV
jgi:hypothetical protein